MAIETGSHGQITFTGEHIRLYEMLVQRSALKLEILGLRHSRGSVYARIKKQYGFRGSRQQVLEQLQAKIDHDFPTEA
jgi:hypothetical protein